MREKGGSPLPVVTATNVQKAHGVHVVLRSASVTVSAGERVGVIGKNGAGKSTVARLLAGSEPPDAGSVSRRRGADIAYLVQVPRFEGDPTAQEAVEAGLAHWAAAVARYEEATEALARAERDDSALVEAQMTSAEEVERLGGFEQGHRVASMLGHLGIAREQARISELSGGEQRRVALARILIARPDLAVLDEPTNHLDATTIEWLESHLIDDFPGAVLLITHDRYLLDRVAERTIEIADGDVFSYEGGYELYLTQKAERLAHAERTEQNRQNFLRRELEWLRRQPKARTTKQKARIERAKAAEAVEAPRAERAISLEVDLVRSGKTIVEARSLGVKRGDRTLVLDLDLFLTQGDRIGIVGPNGCGKTTLLSTLVGEREPSAGSVTIGQNTKIAYLDQLRSGLDDDKSVFKNVAGDQSRIEIGGAVVEPRSYLERFGFDGAKQRQPVGSLSGGERARVALAKMLRQGANLVVMDEPTNDLDVSTLGALEAMLTEMDVTALVVTHDRWFLDRVATSILAFEGNGAVVRYPGNYDAYRRLRAEADTARAKETPAAVERPTRAKAGPQNADDKNRLTQKERRELEGILDVIDASETKLAELNARLSDPDLYAGGGKDVAPLLAEVAALKTEIERLTARWEELESKKQNG